MGYCDCPLPGYRHKTYRSSASRHAAVAIGTSALIQSAREIFEAVLGIDLDNSLPQLIRMPRLHLAKGI